MTNHLCELAEYGWSGHFQVQLDQHAGSSAVPVRVLAAHRGEFEVAGPAFTGRIKALPPAGAAQAPAVTVGDWLLVDPGASRMRALLERKSLFRRKAAGTEPQSQLIAANVDTAIVVTSCNHDFNPARLERYLALVRDAMATPLIVLTRADLVDNSEIYAAKARGLARGLAIETLDARCPDAIERLEPWCSPGQTLVLLGSSGVGKSTLVNTLCRFSRQSVGEIRTHDQRGRHTTTGRSMHRLPTGAWLIDTPGMRELQLADVEAGLEDVFADLVALSNGCRFADCRHVAEPGCALLAAVASGAIDALRLRRFQKLKAESARHGEALFQRRERERDFGRKVRSIMKARQHRWDP